MIEAAGRDAVRVDVRLLDLVACSKPGRAVGGEFFVNSVFALARRVVDFGRNRIGAS